MSSETFESVWDAIEDTPVEAENMKLRSTLMMALEQHVRAKGWTQVEAARRLGVTKQAAGQVVDELEEMGILERVADPKDARAKLVRFSKKGQAAMLEGLQVLGEIEAEIRDVIGEGKMRTLHESLAAVIASVEGE